MVEIFTSGCNTCGAKALYVARIKQQHPNAAVYNTRVRKDLIARHLYYQKQSGMGGVPLDIVVEDGGSRIVLLKDWK